METTKTTRVKCYGNREMETTANNLHAKGFDRVENAYWVEHWSNGDEIIIVERCNENEKPNAPETTTPSNDTTMNETTNNAQEYNHAAACLDIYLMNESEIYNRFTVSAIAAATTGIKNHGNLFVRLLNSGAIASGDIVNNNVNKALQAAARLVQKHDHMTPTPADIAAVKANYVAYIIECAQYEVNNK